MIEEVCMVVILEEVRKCFSWVGLPDIGLAEQLTARHACGVAGVLHRRHKMQRDEVFS